MGDGRTDFGSAVSAKARIIGQLMLTSTAKDHLTLLLSYAKSCPRHGDMGPHLSTLARRDDEYKQRFRCKFRLNKTETIETLPGGMRIGLTQICLGVPSALTLSLKCEYIRLLLFVLQHGRLSKRHEVLTRSCC